MDRHHRTAISALQTIFELTLQFGDGRRGGFAHLFKCRIGRIAQTDVAGESENVGEKWSRRRISVTLPRGGTSDARVGINF